METNYITTRNFTPSGYLDYSNSIRHTEKTELTHPYDFEIFDFETPLKWAFDHWLFAVKVGLVYIGVIFAIQHWMKNRAPYNLKMPLAIWNAAIGIFSICGFVRVLPEFYHVLSQPEGFYRSVCVVEPRGMPYMFWGTMFVFSKFIELADTLFIVLRKKELVVLQWYHHFITMIAGWAMLPYDEAINLWYPVLNYGVHSMMYTYFALKALDFKIPAVIATFITTCQFAQMVTALTVGAYSAILYYSGVPCYREPFTLKLSFAITVSFNILFGELFYKNVILKKRNNQKLKKDQ